MRLNLLTRVFRVKDSMPEIIVTDGKDPLKTFSGTGAVADSQSYIESTL